MADESISVEIKDGVDKGVAREINQISTAARTAYQNVDRLIKQINRIQPRAIQQFNSVVTNAQRQMQNAALSAQRLATETQRTATAATRGATAQKQLATATARTASAESAAASAALRLESAQTRAAAANDRAAASAKRAADAAAQQTRNIAANERELERVNGIHDRYNAVLARNPKYAQAFASNTAKVGKAAGLTRHELQNLSFQLNDVAVGFASGQKPLTIFMQQGAQIGQIFGASGAGAGAIFRQLAGLAGTLITRLGLLGIVIGAVLAPFALFTREFNKGFDGEAFVKSLNLTEKQMERLKKSGEELRVTFGDTFKATFQVIGRYAEQYFKPTIDLIGKWWNKTLDFITTQISFSVRLWLGLFLGFANALKVAWNNIPETIELAVKTAMNKSIDVVEFGINQISNAIANSPLGKLLGVDGATFEIKLPRLDLSEGAQDVGTQIAKGFADGFSTADKIVTQFGKDVRAQAIKNAQDRIKAAAGKRDKGAGSHGFDRAKELAQINAQLDAQAKHLFKLADARDAYNQVEEIALRFQKEGKPLTQTEIESLRTKIQALNDAKQVQQEFDRIYNSATGAQKQYAASLEAANKLLQMGAISQAQYTAEVKRANKALAESTVEGRITAELEEQLNLLKLLPKQREIEQQVTQAVNEATLRGETLNVEKLREKLKLLQLVNDQMQITDELQANSRAQQSINRQMKTQAAIGQVGVNGFGGGDAVSQLAQDNPALEATKEFALAQLAAYQDMYAQIEELRQADLISEQSAMMAKFALFNQQAQQYLATAQGIFGNLAQLRNSDNKKAAAIGKKAAIAQALINTYTGATAAFQSAATIPYVGWILAPVAAAAAIAAGMAQVQAIRAQGYKQGGYTGNMPVDSIAGPVHGQEYVFDAPATARIGVGNLEALRKGRMPIESLMRGESDSTETTANAPVRMGDREVNYNQTVQVTVQGKSDRRTAEQSAKAIRRESTKELIRSGAG